MIFKEVTADDILEVCGAEPGFYCRNVLRVTENETLADVAQWLADGPIRIVLIVVVAWFANRITRKVIRQVVQGMTGDSVPKAVQAVRKVRQTSILSTDSIPSMRSEARARTMGSVLKSIASAVIWTIAALMVLGELGINLAPLIAGAGIVGVAVGFGAQSLVKDFLSGLFMLAEDQYGVGDVIDLGEAKGVVEAVNLRTTRLRGVDGTVWHVPNGEIRRVGNMSQQWARVVLDITVAYDTDIDRAVAAVKSVADTVWHDDDFAFKVIEEPEVLGVENLGTDGITIRLIVKTQPGEQWTVAREIRRRIKPQLDAEGIEIPLPQRVMWMRDDRPEPRPRRRKNQPETES